MPEKTAQPEHTIHSHYRLQSARLREMEAYAQAYFKGSPESLSIKISRLVGSDTMLEVYTARGGWDDSCLVSGGRRGGISGESVRVVDWDEQLRQYLSVVTKAHLFATSELRKRDHWIGAYIYDGGSHAKIAGVTGLGIDEIAEIAEAYRERVHDDSHRWRPEDDDG